jgi:hypothetical protein
MADSRGEVTHGGVRATCFRGEEALKVSFALLAPSFSALQRLCAPEHPNEASILLFLASFLAREKAKVEYLSLSDMERIISSAVRRKLLDDGNFWWQIWVNIALLLPPQIQGLLYPASIPANQGDLWLPKIVA